jgi:hypothetical protein
MPSSCDGRGEDSECEEKETEINKCDGNRVSKYLLPLTGLILITVRK